MIGENEKFDGVAGGRRRECVSCSCVFSEGQHYYSALSEFEDSYMRRDFCGECWGAEERIFASDAAAVSQWRSVQKPFEDGEKKPPRTIEKDKVTVLLDILENACKSDEKPRMNLAYALSLVLARKRYLEMTKDPGGGSEGTIYFRARGVDREFFVKDVTLSDDEIDCVMKELERLMGERLS